MGSSPALQTPLHSRGPWAQAGDRWLWELPGHSSVPCSGLYQRWASGKSVSTSGLSWWLDKWGKDASQGCREGGPGACAQGRGNHRGSCSSPQRVCSESKGNSSQEAEPSPCPVGVSVFCLLGLPAPPSPGGSGPGRAWHHPVLGWVSRAGAGRAQLANPTRW